MSAYVQSLYQIVYSTKYREHTLIKEHREELFKYISGVLKNKRCHLYQIGGVTDHIHIVTSIHQSVCVADLVKDIKLSSDDLIKRKGLFPRFNGWQGGYAAFTYSIEAKENLIKYVMNQEIHHQKVDYLDELRQLLKAHHIEFDEKYLL